jgi:hypothetical protein
VRVIYLAVCGVTPGSYATKTACEQKAQELIRLAKPERRGPHKVDWWCERAGGDDSLREYKLERRPRRIGPPVGDQQKNLTTQIRPIPSRTRA